MDKARKGCSGRNGWWQRVLLVVLLLLAPIGLLAGPVTMRGANGTTVEFAGVKAATPRGLVLMVSPERGEMLVPWASFDLTDLELEHREIHAAMQAAVNQGRTTELNLGIYASMVTVDDFTADLKTALAREVTVKVPPLSVLFDDRDIEDGHFLWDSINDFKSAENRSQRNLEDYKTLLRLMLGWRDPELHLSTHTLIYGSKRYPVITEATPARTEAKIPRSAILEFFAVEDNRVLSEGILFLRYNDRELSALRAIFQDASDQLAKGKVMGEQVDLNRYQYQFEFLLETLATMRESTTLPHGFERDWARAMTDFQLK